MKILFNLKYQEISRSDNNLIAASSKNYVTAKFLPLSFDWVKPITAIFGDYCVELDNNMECIVPWEVLENPGKVNVSAFCGDLHTSNVVTIDVVESGYKQGETPQDPTPDLYHEITQKVNEAVNISQEALEKSESSQIYAEEAKKIAEEAKQDYTSLLQRIASLEIIISSLNAPGAGAHNAIYRGKFLGELVTEAQYAAIADGTFADLYIGDYWTINNRVYRIAAFDYLLNTGNKVCTTHHALMVPDENLYLHKMNDTNTTNGAYVGSKMYTEGLEQAKTTIKAAFSGHVLSHRIYLTNAVADGHPSAGAWYDSEVDLMCEQMVYGGSIFMPIANGSAVYTNYRVEKSQLPLFAHAPSMISNRQSFWLRDVISASRFAVVAADGLAASGTASTSLGVRPYFCIY